MDCKTTEYYVSAFFDDNIDIKLRYEIVYHLLRCAKCYQIYDVYAKDIGLHFDIVREASRVQLEWQDDIPKGDAIYMTKRKTSSIIEFKKPIVKKKDNPQRDAVDRWTTAHKLNDYSELMNIKAVRDIYNTENKSKDYGDNKKGFVDFLTKKVCQKIDFLEKCYKIERET